MRLHFMRWILPLQGKHSASPLRLRAVSRSHTASGVSSPARSLRVVDFPVPEAPMMPTASPRRILKEQPCRIFLLPNALWTPRSSNRISESLVTSDVLGSEPVESGIKRPCKDNWNSGRRGGGLIHVHSYTHQVHFHGWRGSGWEDGEINGFASGDGWPNTGLQDSGESGDGREGCGYYVLRQGGICLRRPVSENP